VRFAFVEAKKAEYPVSVLCRVLQIERSGFYAWRTRGESNHTVEDRRLAIEVRAVFEESKRRYGSPRVFRALRGKGVRVGRHRVARLMCEHALRARGRRRFVATTNSKHTMQTSPNRLKRVFKTTAADRVWAADVTYLPTGEGWLFLAVVLDLYSRRVVGWALSEHNDEVLTLSALRMALDQRRPSRGLVHHSDRGSTYASGEYQDVLAANGIVGSMSRKGDCWDNAVVESFFSTLDVECARQQPFPSRSAARREVVDYILSFYNPTRLHSYLNYKSPMEFERAA
jgi:putative transposase